MVGRDPVRVGLFVSRGFVVTPPSDKYGVRLMFNLLGRGRCASAVKDSLSVIVHRCGSNEGQGWPVRWARTASCR